MKAQIIDQEHFITKKLLKKIITMILAKNLPIIILGSQVDFVKITLRKIKGLIMQIIIMRIIIMKMNT
jgi:hypothetical protein